MKKTLLVIALIAFTSGCNLTSDEKKALAIGAGVLAVIGVVAACKNGGCGGGGGSYTPYSYASATDTEWDWDQFYGSYNTLQWRCRGVQTGRFADDYNCLGKFKTDSRWPGK